MNISRATAQLRTTDLEESIRFYTEKLGLKLEFQYEDFYAGIRAGDQSIHLKFACDKDPSIDFVHDGGHFHLYLETDDVSLVSEELKKNGVAIIEDVHDTDWGTRELIIKDDQGHTLYFGQGLS